MQPRDTEQFEAGEYDLLVIGGGVYGLAIAYDAASRGITSKHHLWIFWGFLLIQIGAIEMFLQGFHEDTAQQLVSRLPPRSRAV